MHYEMYYGGGLKVDCEYFCNNCKQLRISFLPKTTQCKNCKSSDIIKGEPGKLDKEKLKGDIK